jgi:signal peptidase I
MRLRAAGALLLAIAVAGCGSHRRPSESQTGSLPENPLPQATFWYPAEGPQMEPTLHCSGQGEMKICGARIQTRVRAREPFSDAHRGDIVVFRVPRRAYNIPGCWASILRAVGLPGEVWSEREGFVYIDGKRLNEPYVPADRRDSQNLTMSDIPPKGKLSRIPKNMYLMMGDNRSVHCDSRRWGLVPRANLIGEVVEICLHWVYEPCIGKKSGLTTKTTSNDQHGGWMTEGVATSKLKSTAWGEAHFGDALACLGVGQQRYGNEYRNFVCVTYFSNRWRVGIHTTDCGGIVIDNATPVELPPWRKEHFRLGSAASP